MMIFRQAHRLLRSQTDKLIIERKPMYCLNKLNSRPFSSQLAKTLHAEIKHEGGIEITTEYKKLKDEMSKSWSFNNVSGSSVVTMTKQWNDESVAIEFNVQDIAVDYGLNEISDDVADLDVEDLSNGLNFSITIDKKEAGKILIHAIGGEKGLSIRNIRYLQSHEEAEKKDEGYAGPIFQDLEESLQEEFFKFLEERGVDDVLGGFVLSYAEEKEENEYIHWLKSLRTFVSK